MATNIGEAVGVRHDRGLVVGDDLPELREQVSGVATRRAVVEDSGRGSHPVDGLDVERLLAVPGVAAAVRRGARVLGDAEVDVNWPGLKGGSPWRCESVFASRSARGES